MTSLPMNSCESRSCSPWRSSALSRMPCTSSISSGWLEETWLLWRNSYTAESSIELRSPVSTSGSCLGTVNFSSSRTSVMTCQILTLGNPWFWYMWVVATHTRPLGPAVWPLCSTSRTSTRATLSLSRHCRALSFLNCLARLMATWLNSKACFSIREKRCLRYRIAHPSIFPSCPMLSLVFCLYTPSYPIARSSGSSHSFQ
mmetsp:Transcript_11974/g.23640  ORF Transcript_11974/g.23640 Transcript_11974/m.23640 type:complete len:201 (-) Transcript_11974:1028-1630(-)